MVASFWSSAVVGSSAGAAGAAGLLLLRLELLLLRLELLLLRGVLIGGSLLLRAPVARDVSNSCHAYDPDTSSSHHPGRSFRACCAMP